MQPQEGEREREREREICVYMYVYIYIYIHVWGGGFLRLAGTVLWFQIIRDSDSIWDLGIYIAIPLLMVTNICKHRRIWYIG